VQVLCEFYCMVDVGKLLATGFVTSCCPGYISGRHTVSPPLASKILDCEDVCKKENKNNRSFQPLRRTILRRTSE